MSLFSSVHRIHLIGICGTAMASLAGMLKESGYEVSGSDQNVYPPMSTELEKLGIHAMPRYDETNLQPRPDLVVIGNALSRGNPEVERVLDDRISYASLPEVVRELYIRGRTSIVVAGTHGKTTTTSMLAWICECAGLKPNFLIGGLPRNFGKSYQLAAGEHFIIEGDEYDTAFFDKGAKFLHYLPNLVILNNIEFDHADIYADLEAVKISFQRLINLIPRNGLLVCNARDPIAQDISRPARCNVVPFGIALGEAEGWVPKEGFWARGLQTLQEGTGFSVSSDRNELGQFVLPQFGEFNVSNAVAAIAAACSIGISAEKVAQAVRTFQGVRRRMEIRGSIKGKTVIDDFAHHPTAIRETLQGIRARFPRSRVWALVEPRSATMRRRVVENELSHAFAEANEIVLADVFSPERIAADQRLSPAHVVEALVRMGKSARFVKDADSIVNFCAERAEPGDVFVVFSNGNFDNIHSKLLEVFGKEQSST